MAKFGVICADPPWSFDDRLVMMKRNVRRAAVSRYDVMTVEQVADVPVSSVADPAGCLLALWVPGSLLHHGFEVMQRWGFKHKQVFVWVKLKKCFSGEGDMNQVTRVGMGRLFRQSHEIALIGTSGKSVYSMLKDHSQRSVAFDINVGHSVKPGTLQDRLDLMFPDNKKLELFSCRVRPGWTCVGNAIDGKDVFETIQELVDR